MTYFCVNYGASPRRRFERLVKADASVVWRPFFLDVLAQDESIRMWVRYLQECRVKLADFVSGFLEMIP